MIEIIFPLLSNLALLLSLAFIFFLLLKIRSERKVGEHGPTHTKRVQAQLVFVVPVLAFLLFLYVQVSQKTWGFYFSPIIALVLLIILMRRDSASPEQLNKAIVKHSLWFMLLPGMESGVASTNIF